MVSVVGTASRVGCRAGAPWPRGPGPGLVGGDVEGEPVAVRRRMGRAARRELTAVTCAARERYQRWAAIHDVHRAGLLWSSVQRARAGDASVAPQYWSRLPAAVRVEVERDREALDALTGPGARSAGALWPYGFGFGFGSVTARECDHDRDTCMACVAVCRVCGAREDSPGLLTAHVADAHRIGRYDCKHCGRPGGH